MDLNSSVTGMPAVSEKVAAGLNYLKIRKMRDLLFYFPSRHEDRRILTKIKDVLAGTQMVLRGKISQITAEQTFRRMSGRARRVLVTRATLSDETGDMPIVWFHQRFIEKNFTKGTEAIVVGVPTLTDSGIALVSPEIEKIVSSHEPVHAARLTPIYPETANVTSRFLRYLMSRALPLTTALVEYLPAQIREENGLISFNEAIRNIHFPESFEDLANARKRLAFDELFILQLAALARKKERTQEKTLKVKMDDSVIEEAFLQLPFTLTESQKKAISDIVNDMRSGIPMNRLIAGDVGSGKTVVAGLAAYVMKMTGAQTVLAAPTEILATQHAEGLSKLFENLKLNVALLTGSSKSSEKKTIVELVEKGKVDLLIGTHALFHAKIKFPKLGLVTVDEQHRFGVEQRDELVKKGTVGIVPHFLSLTATPIPRTLQLTAYGDVDVSPLEARPGQKVVKTEVVSPEKRSETYRSLAERMEKGEQVFVICPRVEENEEEDIEIKSVVKEYEKLRSEIFPHFKVKMVHGKLPTDEKKKVLEEFRNGTVDLLVASSVVEVGVDIPRATALLIEGAERFGLAQLHQFRGRVGRRGQEAVCYLASSSEDGVALDRLAVLEDLSDGLKIAEEDLKRRGAGEIYGTRQSGGVKLKVANIADVPFLISVRKAAEGLLDRDPELKTAQLIKKRIVQLNVTTHFE